MPDQIFISYRRDDAAYVTGHINDLLRKEFGDEAVFTDVDNIALGVDFRAVLDQTVSQCQVLLAVIGGNWLTVQDQDGRPRLEDPADFVRIEIESALKRDIPVIPLLVAGATMPAAEELPDSLQGLAFRNGTQIRPAPDFRVDMARLVKNLRQHFDGVPVVADDEPVKKSQPADVRAKRDASSKRARTAGVSVQVGETESARKRAELGIDKKSKGRWIAPIMLIAIAGLAGGSWYYLNEKPEAVEASIAEVHSLPPEAEELPEIVVEPGADSAIDLSAGATFEPADIADTPADPEPDIESGDSDTVLDASEASADEGLGTDEPEVVDEIVDEVADIEEASAPAETEPVFQGEVVETPDSAGLIGEGVRLAAIGEHETAIQNFDQAIRLDGEQAFYYKQRGASYEALGQFEAAVRDYDEAIRLNNEDVNAYYRRGVSHQALQNYEAAIADFSVVIGLDPEYVSAYSRRADAYDAIGDAEAAARDRETVAGKQ